MSSTKTIGIIGGGQLGQMMAISSTWAHGVITLDPAADCPSSRVSEVIVAPYDDVRDALRQLADRCDVLTYEFENVDADGMTLHSSKTVNFHKEQTCFVFHKTVFLRGLPLKQG